MCTLSRSQKYFTVQYFRKWKPIWRNRKTTLEITIAIKLTRAYCIPHIHSYIYIKKWSTRVPQARPRHMFDMIAGKSMVSTSKIMRTNRAKRWYTQVNKQTNKQAHTRTRSHVRTQLERCDAFYGLFASQTIYRSVSVRLSATINWRKLWSIICSMHEPSTLQPTIMLFLCNVILTLCLKKIKVWLMKKQQQADIYNIA